jgi:hypothetical protein
MAVAAGVVLVGAAPARAHATWTVVPSPNAAGSNELLAVAAADPTHVWAVGRVVDFGPRPPTFRSLLLRWNGAAWTADPHPRFSGNHQLAGVDAASATDAWAVGSFSEGYAGRTLVERWDGTRWSVVASPNPNPTGSNHLAAVKVVPNATSGTLWAVGNYGTPGTTIGSTNLTLLRSGGAWRQFATPAVTVSDVLESVDATGPGDAWAVGWGSTSPFGGTAVAITLRWNGSRWSSVPIPQPSPVMLFGVEALAPNDVWAVGQTYLGGAHWVPIVVHWDGARWTRSAVGSFPNGGALRDIVAFSPNRIYAVGLDGEGTNARSLVLHWDGAAWTREATPSPPVGPKLYGVATVAPATVWGVGHRYDQAAMGNRTLILRTGNG